MVGRGRVVGSQVLRGKAGRGRTHTPCKVRSLTRYRRGRMGIDAIDLFDPGVINVSLSNSETTLLTENPYHVDTIPIIHLRPRRRRCRSR